MQAPDSQITESMFERFERVIANGYSNPRVLCSASAEEGSTLYTCSRCCWTLRVEAGDATCVRDGFDVHRCNDFPLR